MTWTKLSDDYSDDCWTLSDGAFRLHTELLVWSNRKLLDCRVPIADLPRATCRGDFLPELVDKGWADCDGETIEIVHHACYQRSRERSSINRGRTLRTVRGGADQPDLRESSTSGKPIRLAIRLASRFRKRPTCPSQKLIR